MRRSYGFLIVAAVLLATVFMLGTDLDHMLLQHQHIASSCIPHCFILLATAASNTGFARHAVSVISSTSIRRVTDILFLRDCKFLI